MSITEAVYETGAVSAGQPMWGANSFAVTCTVAVSIERVFAGSTSWIALPGRPNPVAGSSSSRLTRLLTESRTFTGWSQRDLASVLGTSHTTVRRLEADGRVTPRSRDIAARAAQLHGVLARLSPLTTGPEHLATMLATPGPTGTPADLLRAGDWSRAYLLALDLLRPPTDGMLGASPVPMLPATRELRP